MSNANAATPNAHAFDAAPFFALWRASLDEAEAHAQRWMALAASQLAEGTRVATALRAQGLTAFRGAIDAAERMTVDVAAATGAFMGAPSVRK